MNDPLTESAPERSPLKIGAVLATVTILALAFIPTCRAPAPVDTDTDTSKGAQGTGSASTAQCERTLQSALDGLQPGRLGLSSDARTTVDTLNNWRAQCLGDVNVVGEDDRKIRESLLNAKVFEQTELDRFQEPDAEHIRNSLLARTIVDVVAFDGRNDLDRAVLLFNYVVRTIEIIPSEVGVLPVTPYESLVFGGGSPADRAWTYALLLRQLRLDCVMLQPRIDGKAPYWLLAVVIPGDDVYLFDPKLGLPIALADDVSTPLPTQPATLAQVRKDDALLRQYDVGDSAYPLSSEDFSTVDVFAIGTSSTFAPRMADLQSQLAESIELYDGLADNKLRDSGLKSRLIVAGADGLWPAENVRVWPYPESHWGDSQEMTEDEVAMLAQRWKMLEAPFGFRMEIDDAGEPTFFADRPKRNLHHARIAQLKGDYKGALQVYLRARIVSDNLKSLVGYLRQHAGDLQSEVVPPNVARQPVDEANSAFAAIDQATFWSAQTKFEQQDYAVTAQSLARYLSRGQVGSASSAVTLYSLSLANDGQPAEAAKFISQVPPTASRYRQFQWLSRRWNKQAGTVDAPASSADTSSDGKQVPNEDSQKPVEDKPGMKPKSSKPQSEAKEDPAESKDAEPKTEAKEPNGDGKAKAADESNQAGSDQTDADA